jgi:hypothetical protein
MILVSKTKRRMSGKQFFLLYLKKINSEFLCGKSPAVRDLLPDDIICIRNSLCCPCLHLVT